MESGGCSPVVRRLTRPSFDSNECRRPQHSSQQPTINGRSEEINVAENPNREAALEETTIQEPSLDTSSDDFASKIGNSGARRGATAGRAQRERQAATHPTTHWGSRGKLSDEIDHEMLSRLRIASLLLFCGNLAFLIRDLLWPPQYASMSCTEPFSGRI